MNTILFKNQSGNHTLFSVIDTVLPIVDCKSLAGAEFNAQPTVTSASVIDAQGNEVLLLEKDKITLKCTKRISK